MKRRIKLPNGQYIGPPKRCNPIAPPPPPTFQWADAYLISRTMLVSVNAEQVRDFSVVGRPQVYVVDDYTVYTIRLHYNNMWLETCRQNGVLRGERPCRMELSDIHILTEGLLKVTDYSLDFDRRNLVLTAQDWSKQ